MTILEELDKPASKPKKTVVKRAPRTIKEKKFAKEYLERGNATQAALEVYGTSYTSARQLGSQMVAKLDMTGYFQAAGLTDDVIAQNVTRIALTSKKQNQFTGEIESDDAMQLRATDLALKVMGKFAPPRAAVDESGKTVIPIIDLNAILGDDSHA